MKKQETDEHGQYEDPLGTQSTMAVMYFHGNGKTPPQIVCTDAQVQVRMDIVMAALMTVMVIEAWKTAVVKNWD